MTREFCINLEDSSEREISQLLYDLFRECIRGEVSLLNRLRLQAEKRRNNGGNILEMSQGVDSEYLENYEQGSENDSDDEEMEE